MTTMTLPAFNMSFLAGYVEMKPICKSYKEGLKIAEISIFGSWRKGIV